MKLFFKILFTFLVVLPISPYSEESNFLQEFDDDAFLSSKEDSQELVGWSLFNSSETEATYTINFNSVSIVEYLRFVGKIANVNFQFDEKELNFTISVLADDPLTVPNIVSALIQTLRARGFSVLEQDNNLLITSSGNVNQIATIVTPENKKAGEKSPIVTRIFRIENASLTSLAKILTPMLSSKAMIDVSTETRQLIVTDITTNVDKVSTLIRSLDTAHSPLDIDIYRAEHMSATKLALLAEQIIKPFAGDSPFILVPQVETNSIFIVSSPHLLERTVEVVEDLDKAPGKIKGPMGDQVFLYKIMNKSAEELLEVMKEIASELEGAEAQSVQLIAALENARYIQDSHSLLFVTDGETQKKLEAILKTLDSFSDTRSYYIYKLQKSGEEQIERSLKQLSKSLRGTAGNQDLINAIGSMRYIHETNSFIFTGTDESLKKLRELLPTFDVAASEYSPSSHYSLYTPKYLSGEELEKAMEELEESLKSSGLANKPLLRSIRSMRWVPATNTLLFTGDPDSLAHIESLIKLIDVPSGSPNKIFIYKPQYISNDQIEDALDELADRLDHKNLSDRNLSKAIDDMAWIQESQIFLFKADPGSIEKLEEFLKGIDNLKEAEAIANAYYLYKLEFARGDDVLEQLDKIAHNLPSKDPQQKAIISVIDSASFLRDSNAILLAGTQKAVEEVKALIAEFDIKGSTPPSFEKTSFFIYKPKHLSAPLLEEALKETAADLKRSGLIDSALLQSIETMRIVEVTGSVLFTGTEESLKKTQKLLENIDIPGAHPESTPGEDVGEFAGQNFFIYKVHYSSLSSLMNHLQKIREKLEKSSDPINRGIAKSLKDAKEIKESNSILFTGPPRVLEKIAVLMKQIDVPTGISGEVGDKTAAPEGYVIYKPVHVSGPELIDLAQDFKLNLQHSGVREPGLFQAIDNLRFIERTGYILISGNAQAVEKVQELFRKFDAPGVGGVTALSQMETSFLVYKLHYHPGNELQETLKKIASELSASDPNKDSSLMKAINSLQWIKITNSLLATGNPAVLTQLKELIQNIDIPLRQVFIEVLIIRTTIVNNQQFGLQWGGKVQYLNRFAGGVSNFPAPPPGGSANTALAPALSAVNAVRTPQANDIPNPVGIGGASVPGGFDLGVIGDIILHRGKTFISLASLVSALQADEDTVIVMNPKIVAQDNQQATIFVGQNIPFTGSQVSNVQGVGSQVQANIEYRDVGTNLTITPILGTNDIVTLDILNEISSQVENNTAGGAELQGLQTTRTSLNARVHVPNKHFVALSGMISDTKTHFRSGIPCLGGLPVIGAAFSQNDRLNSRDNLIFFIRPVIIDSIEEYERITQNQECLYKELAEKQVLKEEIDDGINWIKDADFYCE